MYNAKILRVQPSRNGGLPYAICQVLGTPQQLQEFKAIRDNCGQRAQLDEDGTVTFTMGLRNFKDKGIKLAVGTQFQMDVSTGSDGIDRTYLVTNTAGVVEDFSTLYDEVRVRQMLGAQRTAPVAVQQEEPAVEEQPNLPLGE